MAKQQNKRTQIECTLDMESGELVIRMPITVPPAPSATGKTLVICSSRGNFTTTATYEGKPIVIGVNGYLKK